MASTRENFAAYLRAAMEAAALPRVEDLSAATGGAVKISTLYRWLRADGDEDGELSWKRLRAVADVLGIPPLEMFVAAGLLSPEEARFEGRPQPPEKRTIEDEIRSDRRLSPERQEALITLLGELREEHTGRTSVRARRTQVPSDQGIDTDVNTELSG